MKRIFSLTLRLLGVILVAVLGIAAYVQIKGIPTYKPIIPTDFKADATPQRVEHGLKLVTLACYDCHVSKEENSKLSYPATIRTEGIAPSQYGTKGLLGPKFADVEEKYDLTHGAEGFIEKDEEGADLSLGPEGTMEDAEGSVGEEV